MSNLTRGPSIDASYQVSVHLAMWFQRRRFKCQKLTDDRHQVMPKAHMPFWQGELKKGIHEFARLEDVQLWETVNKDM